jgi:hypothetical protein
MGVGLEGGDESVEAQGEDAGADEGQAAVFADALPDQPGPTDLGQRGQAEQQHRAQHGHVATIAGVPHVEGTGGIRQNHLRGHQGRLRMAPKAGPAYGQLPRRGPREPPEEEPGPHRALALDLDSMRLAVLTVSPHRS